MSKAKEVATVVLYDKTGRRFLLGKRSGDRDFVGKFEFPGGKLEDGETVETAAFREIFEELGLTADQVEITGSLGTVESNSPKGVFRLNLVTMRLKKGSVVSKHPDHSEIIWVDTQGARVLELIPSNYRVLELIENTPNEKRIFTAARGFDLFLAGKKSCTSRLGDRRSEYPVGTRLKFVNEDSEECAEIEITDVYVKPLGLMTEDEALSISNYSRADGIKEFKEIYGGLGHHVTEETQISFVWFKAAG